ncbi:MAG: porin family protein [Bradyrhizobiaceae bacterium]|nr:MAG: porin family protein [Bradyrhizobiaceae bacterium]
MIKKFVFAAAFALAPLVANAADLPRKAPVAYVDPVYNWTGFYAGGSIGFGTAQNTYEDLDDWYNGYGARYTHAKVGAVFGGQLGYNFQSGHWVYGVETDMHYNTAKLTAVVNTCNSECAGVNTNANWMGSVRGRIGWAQDKTLFYVTGGLAYGNPDSKWYENSNPNEFNRTGWRVGYAVGGGVEYALSRQWSLRGEAIYYDLGSQNVTGITETSYNMRVSNNQIIGLFGANYHF